MTDAWGVLGIEPTQDVTQLRRAYARRLKQTNPEDDADGFIVLRDAYEWALAWAAEVAALEGPPGAVCTAAPGSDRASDRQPAGGAELQTFDPVRAQWRSELDEAFAGLEALVQGPHRPDRDDLNAAFSAVTLCAAIDDMALYVEFENRIAELILVNAPYSDGLIGRATAYFCWKVGSVAFDGASNPRVDAVLARAWDLRFLAELRDPWDRRFEAYLALARPPRGPAWWPFRVPGRRAEAVRALLDELKAERPGLLANLHPEALAEWTRWVARPRRNPWAQLGWAPAAVSLLLLAAVLPATGLSAAVISILGIGLVSWAFAVGEPDRREGEWRFSVQLRALFAHGALWIWWFLSWRTVESANLRGQLTLAILAAVCAYGCAAKTAIDWWFEDLDERRRTTWLRWLGLAAFWTIPLGWAASYVAELRPIWAAVTASVVILHKPAGAALDQADTNIRYFIRCGGFFAAIAFLTWGVPDLLVSGLWMMSGVLYTVAVAHSAPRRDLAPADG